MSKRFVMLVCDPTADPWVAVAFRLAESSRSNAGVIICGEKGVCVEVFVSGQGGTCIWFLEQGGTCIVFC